MSNNIGKRIREIREAEGLSRDDFCSIIGLKVNTLTQIETGRTKSPASEAPQAVCVAFPQYTLWLMTEQVNPEGGQISPEIKLAADQLKTGS